MRHFRWLNVLKDYDFEIIYHPGKANVVPDAFSTKMTSAPIRGICLIMIITSPQLDLIRKVPIEGIK